MKAYVRTSADTQEVIQTEVTVPDFNDDEVLIKTEAFGVGIHDRYFIPGNINFPYVIGSEGAGVIAKTGSGVNAFKAGDRVLFSTSLQPQGGSWAEFAVAKKESVISLPDDISFPEGAALPIAGKTALECWRELNLSAGQTLFVAGGSGAIGTLLIQLAKSHGVHVAASASAGNHPYLESLGVDFAVDYRDADWLQKVNRWSGGGVDAVLAIQPGTGRESIKVVKNNSLLVTVSGDQASVIPERNITIRQMGHRPETFQKIAELLTMIENGTLHLHIEKEYPFHEALQALQKTETRHARGKSVVLVNL